LVSPRVFYRTSDIIANIGRMSFQSSLTFMAES
jgi:hypothetical protein